MIQTRKTLLILLISFFLLLFGIIIAYETTILIPGKLSGNKSLIFVQIVMQLSTLALIPIALYLFKFSYINKSVTNPNSYKGFLKWGIVRICLLCIPILFNMLFYYLYGEETGFFYLALISTISVFFIFPTMHRCQEERNPKNEKIE